MEQSGQSGYPCALAGFVLPTESLLRFDIDEEIPA